MKGDTMDEQIENLKHQREDTQEAIAEKLGAIESKFQEAARDVKEKVDNVKHKISEVKETFNLSARTQEHPIPMVAASLATGVVVGALAARRLKRSRYDSTPSPTATSRQSYMRELESESIWRPEDSAYSEAETATEQSVASKPRRPHHDRPTFMEKVAHEFDDEIGIIRGMLISAGLNLLRNTVKQHADKLSPYVNTVADSVEKKMGFPVERPQSSTEKTDESKQDPWEAPLRSRGA